MSYEVQKGENANIDRCYFPSKDISMCVSFYNIEDLKREFEFFKNLPRSASYAYMNGIEWRLYSENTSPTMEEKAEVLDLMAELSTVFMSYCELVYMGDLVGGNNPLCFRFQVQNYYTRGDNC